MLCLIFFTIFMSPLEIYCIKSQNERILYDFYHFSRRNLPRENVAVIKLICFRLILVFKWGAKVIY